MSLLTRAIPLPAAAQATSRLFHNGQHCFVQGEIVISQNRTEQPPLPANIHRAAQSKLPGARAELAFQPLKLH